MPHSEKVDRVRSLPAHLVLLAALFFGAPTHAVGAASLAGVHWYSGDSSMLDLSVPAGERGFNVEVIFDTGWCDGDPSTDPGGMRGVAATAKAHGLVNVIRVDYRQMLAVPPGSAEYASWAADFIKCTQELSDLSSLFVVGNEPNIEGSIYAAAYASAFNHLYSRKGEMPAGTQLLAAFNSPFTSPAWMLDMSSRLGGVDGFAVHTGGVRANCRDPRLACSYGGWSFDGAFRYYRDVIANIHSSWWSRAVYITEFNTYTGDPGSEPDVNYPADWINQAFEEIRNYNATRGTKPAVKALCWFVDRPQSWPRFALRNISAARADMGEEFKNPANRGAGGGSCANDPLAVPSDRWKLEIWNNRGFAGGTVEQRYEAAGGGGFGFQWGSGRPSNCVGIDNFAVRFTRRAYFSTSGSYTFTARTDDGVRLWVDGTNIIDDWRDMPPTDHTGQTTLAAGWHELRMDYYENAGGAVATLSWTGGGTPPANVARNAVGWAASSIYGVAYGGDKAYDGIVSAASKWTSNGATADSWLALDLGRSYDITRFVVKHAGSAGELTGYNTQAFRLESGTSLSGPWTTQATVANTTQANASTVTLPGPVTTRCVRFYITDAGIDNYARIPELEVYGTPSAPPVNHPPTAVATANPANGPAPLAVAFSGAGSSDPDGDPLSYTWTFGDGTTGLGATVSHTYTTRGSYTATLTVDDSHGGSNSATVAITVTNRPPTAVATANPTSGPASLAVAFSGAGSSDPDGDPLSYSWTFGDGTTGLGATVSHTYSTPGSYTATLTVNDSHGGSNGATVAIIVLTAAGSLVNGDFESSTPGSALGTGWIAFSSSGYAPTFAVVSDQIHGGSFAQRVTSPQPSSSDKFAGVYQVVATTPGRQYTVRAWNRTHFTGGNAWDHIARLGIDLAGGNDFQAGSVSWYEFDSRKDFWVGCPGCPTGQPLEVSVTATGPSMTIYLESWRKWASGGESFTWFDDVQVGSNGPPPINHPPTAVATASPTSGLAPLAVTFSGSGSTDPDGDPLLYGWTFGDGGTGSGVTASHTYSSAGTYHATLTVDDGRLGTHSAEVVIVVDPPSGNRPPTAVISASPESGTVPFTVTLDGQGSSDPDGDPVTYTWQFADGVQGTGPTLQRYFPLGDWRRGEGLEEYAGGYLVTLTVTDDEGAIGSASLRIKAIPPQGCPESLDFDAIRAQLAAQGQDLVFSKIGFHTGGGGTINGLGVWERCLDLNGVPFTVKQVPSNANASAAKAAERRKRSGVPHTAIFRRCCVENGVNYELPACAIASASTGWSLCTMENAQQEAQAHWQRHLQAFPPDLKANKHLIWVETINEPWKGSSTRNNAEWLAKFSYYTALEALAAGYNYAAFGWSTGEPEYGVPPNPALDPSHQWDGPEMQNFLRLAAQYPDRIALSLHEYNLNDPTLRAGYPNSAGRFTKVFERCDANGIPRPTVLITEFGWPGVPSVPEIMSADNVPWAAGMYAQHPQVKGVALWDDGGVVDAIAAFTTYSLQNYFAIPSQGGPSRPTTPLATPEDR